MDDRLRPDLHARDHDQDDVAFSAREREIIAKGLASMETFGTIPSEEVFAWLESLATATTLPMPQPPKALGAAAGKDYS